MISPRRRSPAELEWVPSEMGLGLERQRGGLEEWLEAVVFGCGYLVPCSLGELAGIPRGVW